MNLLSRAGVLVNSAEIVSSSDRWLPDDLSIPIVEPAVVLDTATELEPQVDPAAEAEQRIAAYQIEAEQKIKDAYESGYEEGRLEGEIAEGVRLRNAVTAAELALDEIRENEMQWQNAIRPNIGALAVAIARSIINRELSTDAETIADLVRKALAEFPIDQSMRIRINPHDLSLISACDPQNGSPPVIAPNRDVRWLADMRIEPGGCLVEGREQIVDGRIDTALERVYRRITYTHV